MASESVRIESREIVVERSPLHVHYLSCGVHDNFALHQTSDGELGLQSSRGARVLGWMFCVLGWPPLILAILSIISLLVRLTLEDLPAVLLLLGWGVLFSLLGMKLLGRRCQFDSGAGELRIRHFWRTLRRPLADVVAVQVINAGKFGSDEERFTSYQLNLVLDDPTEPRLFVVYNADLADMKTKARQLADFLHVPLLEPPIKQARRERQPHPVPPMDANADPTQDWAKTDAPLPLFDLEAGALGELALGDPVLQAKFLGRPDRVEHTSVSGMTLHYLNRGFELQFSAGAFAELTCHLSPESAALPEAGRAFSRPRLVNGIQVTPEMTVEMVRKVFGTPGSEDIDDRKQTLTYPGAHYMAFEFELPTGQLLTLVGILVLLSVVTWLLLSAAAAELV